MDRSTLPTYYQYTITPDIVDDTDTGSTPAVTYLGYWNGGASGANPRAEAKWQIRRVTVTGFETITEYANGSETFNKVWNDRADYNYSLLK
jgi:hypothetical protein